MTKEEKIQEAYGEYFIMCNPNKNGWGKYISIGIGLQSFDIKTNDKDERLLMRPKSLNGIENNNGWIKIESESDLPEFFGSDYYVMINNKIT